MELAERLLSVPERENAGACSSNRFTYQQVWAFDYIQYNTYYDRQINNWLHKYVYKRKYDGRIGYNLRQLYENGEIKSESVFEEVLKTCVI